MMPLGHLTSYEIKLVRRRGGYIHSVLKKRHSLVVCIVVVVTCNIIITTTIGAISAILDYS